MGLLDDAIKEHLDLKRRRGADPAEIERAEREALGPVRREPSAFAEDSGPGAPSGTAVSEPPAGVAEDISFVAEPETFVEAPTTVTPPVEDDPGGGVGIAHPDYADPEFDEFAATEAPAASAPELEPAAPVYRPDRDPEPEPKHRRRLFGRRSHDGEDDFDVRPPLPADLPDDDPFAEEVVPEPPAALPTEGDEAVGRATPIVREEPPASPPPTLRITPETEAGNTVEYDVEKAFRDEDDFFVDDGPAAPQAEVPAEDILEETPDFLADTPDHDRLWFEQKAPPDFDFDN